MYTVFGVSGKRIKGAKELDKTTHKSFKAAEKAFIKASVAYTRLSASIFGTFIIVMRREGTKRCVKKFYGTLRF